MTRWERNAKTLETVSGIYVAWDEPKGDRFYVCPCCDEPVYECDWFEEDLEAYFCPVCEDEDWDESALDELRDLTIS